jgi:hypothetical protein
MNGDNTMAEIKMVAKLTTKNMGANPRDIHGVPKGKHLVIAKILGIADGAKQVEDARDGRIFYPITGRFKAVAEDGTETRSGVLYLPSGIHENLLAGVRGLQDGEHLRFALELRAVHADNPVGYSYEAVDLMPRKEVDPLDELMLPAGQAKQALPAPAKQAVPVKK